MDDIKTTYYCLKLKIFFSEGKAMYWLIEDFTVMLLLKPVVETVIGEFRKWMMRKYILRGWQDGSLQFLWWKLHLMHGLLSVSCRTWKAHVWSSLTQLSRVAMRFVITLSRCHYQISRVAMLESKMRISTDFENIPPPKRTHLLCLCLYSQFSMHSCLTGSPQSNIIFNNNEIAFNNVWQWGLLEMDRVTL